MRRSAAFSMVFATAFVLAAFGLGGCGGSSTAPGGVSVNSLDGSTDIAVDSAFTYTFSRSISAYTVTPTSYFIVQTPVVQVGAASAKADIDPTICDSSAALSVALSTEPKWSTLTPAESLGGETSYTICLTSDISYIDGEEFAGFMAQFTTVAGGGGGTTVTITASKLVRLDGTELDFSATPIPRRVSQKYTISAALTEEADRTAFEAAVILTDGDGNTVVGTWSWSDDYLNATFTPTGNLDFKTQYTVTVDNGSMPVVNISMDAAADTMTFTTLSSRDINGDGYDDVIMGTFAYEGGADQGRAYLYHGVAGGIDGTAAANATFTGAGNGDYMGVSVGMAGDVNGDGFIDVILSATAAEGEKGRAYIFHGSASGITDCDLSAGCTTMNATITGPTATFLGNSVDNAGDVNGDGYDDVILGAYKAISAGDGLGRAFVLNGSATGVGDCDMSGTCTDFTTLVGPEQDSLFGISVSTAGDVNNDGFDDVIVGATGVNTNKGKAYLFHGSDNGVGDCNLSTDPTCADATITATAADGRLGCSVSTARDINGDGYADVIVGADGVSTNTGRAYVFTGSANGIGDCDLSGACTNLLSTITGTGENDRFGDSVYTAGDVNGDGTPDIFVGAYMVVNAPYLRGKAYVFLGSALSANMTPADAKATFTGAEGFVYLGDSVSTAGDVNGDGYDDVIVGAPGIDGGGKGNVYIFNGSATGPSDCNLGAGCTADTTFTGENAGDCLHIVRSGAIVI